MTESITNSYILHTWFIMFDWLIILFLIGDILAIS